MRARPAARATAGSPAACIIRVNPVGPNTIGIATSRPRIVVVASTDATSRSAGTVALAQPSLHPQEWETTDPMRTTRPGADIAPELPVARPVQAPPIILISNVA